MCRIILSPVASPAVLYVFVISEKLRDFLKKKDFEHKICVLIFCVILSEKFLILRRIERDMIKNVFLDSCKLPVIFV